LYAGGEVFLCQTLINCAGLYSDRIARLAGFEGELPQILPFRGEYYNLAPHWSQSIHHLIYPVPDPQFPFLGVHLNLKIDGSIEAGPNAVLATAREGYSKMNVNLRDCSRPRLYWVLEDGCALLEDRSV
jgi:L-2-hydroxyglutarate oxidase